METGSAPFEIVPGTVHASAVAWQSRAVLILGPSGSGKSTLALTMMGYGAMLVADDSVVVEDRDGLPWLSAPAAIRGRIEARNIGVLAAAAAPGAWLSVVVDMSVTEVDRLPPMRNTSVLGQDIPRLHKVESAHFAAAVLQYLKAGRIA